MIDKIEFRCHNCNHGAFSVPYEVVIDSTGIRDILPPTGWHAVKRNYGTEFLCPSCIADGERRERMHTYHEFAEYICGRPDTYTEFELESIRADAEDVIKACDRVLNGLKRARRARPCRSDSSSADP